MHLLVKSHPRNNNLGVIKPIASSQHIEILFADALLINGLALEIIMESVGGTLISTDSSSLYYSGIVGKAPYIYVGVRRKQYYKLLTLEYGFARDAFKAFSHEIDEFN
ncbi:hypothetical protein IMSAGC009_01245 [Lachnospiraceae bacterium]|nr:hypothetical protein IMSAGC009_01245 [Lachnospiraceae bacterium]